MNQESIGYATVGGWGVALGNLRNPSSMHRVARALRSLIDCGIISASDEFDMMGVSYGMLNFQ
ncbi:MAG: hypothetical protein WAV47_14895 [Blastocatellia bacterium]